ncbi:regulator [Fusobacterium hominis]|uniref:regulator n=1 Tax=Fusobacterium hominis TaxID=2764326 RepID=UPI0022E4FC6B|nr:regulator [Fusobacterium hominis]
MITVEDLLSYAKNKEKTKSFKVFIKELNDKINCNIISPEEYFDIITSKNINVATEVIYCSCDIFHDERLIQSLKCKDNPCSVVLKILNYDTIYSLANLIIEKSNLTVDKKENFVEIVEDDIKN